jgi:hypothetical protein
VPKDCSRGVITDMFKAEKAIRPDCQIPNITFVADDDPQPPQFPAARNTISRITTTSPQIESQGPTKQAKKTS